MAMTIRDYAEVVALWKGTEGIRVSSEDSRANIGKFLERNRRMSFVARDGKELVGTVLCGHDGRRGYLHHLAVALSHRRLGIGRALVERCLARLRGAGIRRCRAFVLTQNRKGVLSGEPLAGHRRPG